MYLKYLFGMLFDVYYASWAFILSLFQIPTLAVYRAVSNSMHLVICFEVEFKVVRPFCRLFSAGQRSLLFGLLKRPCPYVL